MCNAYIRIAVGAWYSAVFFASSSILYFLARCPCSCVWVLLQQRCKCYPTHNLAYCYGTNSGGALGTYTWENVHDNAKVVRCKSIYIKHDRILKKAFNRLVPNYHRIIQIFMHAHKQPLIIIICFVINAMKNIFLVVWRWTAKEKKVVYCFNIHMHIY